MRATEFAHTRSREETPALCHMYEQRGGERLWKRACDGTLVDHQALDSERKKTGHPTDCSPCTVCVSLADGRGARHGMGLQFIPGREL